MPAQRLLPDTETLTNLRREGWTMDDIAREYGVTKGAVYLQLYAAGLTKKREDYKDLIPWRVRREHANAYPALMLRQLGRRRAGKPLTEQRERMLNRWLLELSEADAVVYYDPSVPPNPASPAVGGWAYVARDPQIDAPDDPIRRPKVEPKAD